MHNTSEHRCLSRSEPNQLELFQVWLNLPKASKMVPPNFLMLWGEQIPELAENGARVKLIAGAAPGFSTPALPPPPDSYARDARSAMLVLTIKLEPNGGGPRGRCAVDARRGDGLLLDCPV